MSYSKNLEQQIIEIARGIFAKEGKELINISKRIGKHFFEAIGILSKCKGRVIVTGVGKSGLAGRKIASTFSSTGTPAFFIHPTEALHGEIGLVRKNDVGLILSKSGESEEVINVALLMKNFGIPVISITSSPHSQIAKISDVCLEVKVNGEVCPYNLSPTTSTTASLVMGDALAIVLLKLKNITKEELARIHPAGTIGKKLMYLVKDLMLTGSYVPIVKTDVRMEKVILEMTSKRGITSVVDKRNKVVGVITDGDLRRALKGNKNIFEFKASDIMTKNPKIISPDEYVESAIKKMEENRITALIVTDKKNTPIGIIHLHDIMQRGVI